MHKTLKAFLCSQYINNQYINKVLYNYFIFIFLN
jgi:hypothetical protein